eukprot:6195964-Pleurochrysis_carterae.AAC.4
MLSRYVLDTDSTQHSLCGPPILMTTGPRIRHDEQRGARMSSSSPSLTTGLPPSLRRAPAGPYRALLASERLSAPRWLGTLFAQSEKAHAARGPATQAGAEDCDPQLC